MVSNSVENKVVSKAYKGFVEIKMEATAKKALAECLKAKSSNLAWAISPANKNSDEQAKVGMKYFKEQRLDAFAKDLADANGELVLTMGDRASAVYNYLTNKGESGILSAFKNGSAIEARTKVTAVQNVLQSLKEAIDDAKASEEAKELASDDEEGI